MASDDTAGFPSHAGAQGSPPFEDEDVGLAAFGEGPCRGQSLESAADDYYTGTLCHRSSSQVVVSYQSTVLHEKKHKQMTKCDDEVNPVRGDRDRGSGATPPHPPMRR